MRWRSSGGIGVLTDPNGTAVSTSRSQGQVRDRRFDRVVGGPADHAHDP